MTEQPHRPTHSADTSRDQSRGVSRRQVAKGLAWSTPAIAMTAAVPAFAASTTTLTATNVTPQIFVSRYYRVPTNNCAKSGGFLDTQGCTPTGGPTDAFGKKSGDCLRNPNSSVGYWLETTNTTSGVARIDSVTTVYTFSNPIVLDSCPNGVYNNDPGATWKWTECTTLNGWTYTLSADGKTLTLKYTKPTIVNTSTATNGTGDYLPGYFINYHTADPCVATTTTITTQHSMTYSTKTAPTGTTFTKNIAARSIV